MLDDLGKKITIEQLECLRCKHKWWPRVSDKGETEIPGTCSKCKSPYWDKPIERKSVSEARKKKK